MTPMLTAMCNIHSALIPECDLDSAKFSWVWFTLSAFLSLTMSLTAFKLCIYIYICIVYIYKQRKLAELTFGHNYGREQQCQSEDCQDGVFAGMGGRQWLPPGQGGAMGGGLSAMHGGLALTEDVSPTAGAFILMPQERRGGLWILSTSLRSPGKKTNWYQKSPNHSRPKPPGLSQ